MKLNTNIYVFNFVLLLSLFRSSEANPEAFISNQLAVNACATVNCAQGSCRVTDDLFGFECDCYSGWKKLQIGPIVLPPCIIPDCTLNFGCGAGSPAAPMPPPPDFNFSDPCTFTWCGDGSCKTTGTGNECDCNAGCDNLMDNPILPCFKECSLGADCHNLGLGTPAAPNTNPSPPNQSSQTPGVREPGKASMVGDGWKVVIILGALFLPWL